MVDSESRMRNLHLRSRALSWHWIFSLFLFQAWNSYNYVFVISKADADIKVPSIQSCEKVSFIQAQSGPEYSHAWFTCCQEFIYQSIVDLCSFRLSVHLPGFAVGVADAVCRVGPRNKNSSSSQPDTDAGQVVVDVVDR